MLNKEPLVSIIVPVYNAEKYLAKCLNSIIKQTYKNLDIIVLNDGSTDNSGNICDEFAKMDNRIRVVHNKNQGVSISRNQGINLSNGEYILFIDSDDDVSKFYVEKFIINTSSNVDVVICGIQDIYENCKLPRNIKWRKINNDLTGEINNDFNLIINYTRVTVAKLFKTEILKQYSIRFPANISFGEDQIFNIHYFSKIKNYKFIHEELYNYYHRNNNSLSNIKSAKNFCDSLKMLTILNNFLIEKQIYQKEIIFLNEIINVMLSFKILSNVDDSVFKEKKRLQDLVRLVDKKYYNFSSLKGTGLKRYILIKLMKYNLYYPLALVLFLKGKWNYEKKFN